MTQSTTSTHRSAAPSSPAPPGKEIETPPLTSPTQSQDTRGSGDAAKIAENLAAAVNEASKMVEGLAKASRSGALPGLVAVLGFLVCIMAPFAGTLVALNDEPEQVNAADFWVTDSVVVAGFTVGGILILGGGVLALLGAVLPAKWISGVAKQTVDRVTETLTFEQRVEQRVAQLETEREMAAEEVADRETQTRLGARTNGDH